MDLIREKFRIPLWLCIDQFSQAFFAANKIYTAQIIEIIKKYQLITDRLTSILTV